MNIKLDNANKLTFLVKEFPEKTVEEILDLLQMPPVQSNAGFWLAQEFGWISEVKDNKISFIKAPEGMAHPMIERDFSDSNTSGGIWND